MKITNKIIQWN